MSVFTRPNRNAFGPTAPGRAAFGPRLGFGEAFATAYDQQVMASSQYSIEAALRAAELENVYRIRRAGGEAPDTLLGSEKAMTAGLNSGVYTDYFTAWASGDVMRAKGLTGMRDFELRKLQDMFPDAGILTYEQLSQGVKDRALAAERRMVQSNYTVGGGIGAFLGGMIGSVDPRTSPVNALSFIFGGAASTAAKRIAIQAGAGGIAETINQFTGVRKTRQLLGLDTHSALDIGMAFVGGAAFQGAFEAVPALGSRLLRGRQQAPSPLPLPASLQPPAAVIASPAAPSAAAAAPSVTPQTQGASLGPPRPLRAAPTLPAGAAPGPSPGRAARGAFIQAQPFLPSTPLAMSRLGRVRAAQDGNDATGLLQAWDGGPPINITPRTDTAIPSSLRPPTGVEVGKPPTLVTAAAARQADPEAFRIYDNLTTARARITSEITRLGGDPKPEVNQRIADITNEIADLRQQRGKGRRQTQQLGKRIDALKAERDELMASLQDSPRVAELRQQLVSAEDQLRELAPVLSRAYGRAQGRWDADEPTQRGVDEAVRGGTFDPEARARIADAAEQAHANPPDLRTWTLGDLVPAIRNTAPEEGEAAIDTVNRAAKEAIETAQKATEQFRMQIGKLAKPAEEGAEAVTEITIPGSDTKILLDDKIEVVSPRTGENTSMTWRQYFTEVEDENKIIEAITSCPL